MAESIIIDTDPGIDDTMAIFYALESDGLEVVGMTTVFGNVDVELVTVNALRLLEIAGQSDIPVTAGAAQPLMQPFVGAAHPRRGRARQRVPGSTEPEAYRPVGSGVYCRTGDGASG
jgi:pyrimidine-specific ribonucleoside hydrolase